MSQNGGNLGTKNRMWLKLLYTSKVFCEIRIYFLILNIHIFIMFRYFRHAAGSLLILSKNLAQYVHINRSVSQSY